MRKVGFIVFLAFGLAGCFEDEPKLPVYYAEQYIDVATDSVICFSGHEDFENFVLFSSQPFDSLQWFWIVVPIKRSYKPMIAYWLIQIP